MKSRLNFDRRTRYGLAALCSAMVLCCAATIGLFTLMLGAESAAGRNAELNQRLESLRSAILERSLVRAENHGGPRSPPELLADCLRLAAEDPAQQRRLTKLGALLDQQQLQRLTDADPDAPEQDDGTAAYALKASGAWIDAMQLEVGHQLELRRADHDRFLGWLQLSGAATLVLAFAVCLLLFRLMRQLARRGHARISSLEAKANRDPLTGLPNRRLLSDRLEQAIARAERRGFHCAVIALDLDGFKPVNDTYGHAVGDVVLRRIGKRLKLALRSEDTVCRIGGDEFVVIIGEVVDPVLAVRRAKELLGRISRPIRNPPHLLNVGASAGIALYPDDAEEGGELLDLADQALYAAKHGGRGMVVTAGEVNYGLTTVLPFPETVPGPR